MDAALPSAEPVVIGRMYLVPCLLVALPYRTEWIPRGGWVPVIGPKHEDMEHLSFPSQHYHVDWRFVPDRCYGAAGWRALAKVVSSQSGFHQIDDAPVIKRRKAARQMPLFPANPRGNPGFQRLEQSFACKRLKPGGICPHRGIDLRPFAQPDGTAICPGHGLRWNLATGESIPHHCAEAAA